MVGQSLFPRGGWFSAPIGGGAVRPALGEKRYLKNASIRRAGKLERKRTPHQRLPPQPLARFSLFELNKAVRKLARLRVKTGQGLAARCPVAEILSDRCDLEKVLEFTEEEALPRLPGGSLNCGSEELLNPGSVVTALHTPPAPLKMKSPSKEVREVEPTHVLRKHAIQ